MQSACLTGPARLSAHCLMLGDGFLEDAARLKSHRAVRVPDIADSSAHTHTACHRTFTALYFLLTACFTACEKVPHKRHSGLMGTAYKRRTTYKVIFTSWHEPRTPYGLVFMSLSIRIIKLYCWKLLLGNSGIRQPPLLCKSHQSKNDPMLLL